MKKPTLRRIGAYIVDMIVITIISSMFIRIEFLNPKYDEYQKAYNEYVDFTTEVMNNPDKLNDIFSKYDRDDLIRCLEKNHKVVDFVQKKA